MRGVVLLLAVAVVAVLLPASPAFACSCAEAGIDEMVSRHPEVAIAVVRRVDADGGTDGMADVEHTLRGSLPPQVPLELDDGGSCKPHLTFGALATLSFVLDGGGWSTLDCGRLDTTATFGAAFGALVPDPAARGAPSIVVAGGLPGAGLAVLDDHLRVLSVAETDQHLEQLLVCGDSLFTTGWSETGPSATQWSLPALEPVSTRPLRSAKQADGLIAAPQDGGQVLDLACQGDGTVAALLRSDSQQGRVLLLADVMGPASIALQPADDATFAGDQVLLVRTRPDGSASELAVHDRSTGTTSRRAVFPGLSTSEVQAAPDGRHVVIRGFDEDPVLLVVAVADGTTVGRSQGWWMPIAQPWLGEDRLVLQDENHGFTAPASATHRVVDLQLARVPGSWLSETVVAGRVIARDGTLLVVGGAELAVADASGLRRVSADPRTAGVRTATSLAAVAADPDATLPGPAVGAGPGSTAATEPASDPARAPGRRLLPAVAGLSVLLLSVLVATVLIRRFARR